jgi:3-methyladenine DNA glycosylase/8-oxoguanine DNA glycosylase
MKLFIPARPPFSLRAVVHSHGWVQLLPFQADETGSGFTYTDCLSSGRVVELQVDEAPGGIHICVTPEPGAQEQEELVQRAVWMLELQQDLNSFYRMARLEPKLAHIEERALGRVLRSATLFEDVVKTILTTNTLWGGTKRMVASLVNLYGSPLPTDAACRAFPIPEQLAALSLETLQAGARLGYRAPYVLELARSISSGSLNLEELKHSRLPTPELRKRLLQIKGVGGYAAAHLLLLLGRYDFIPIDSWALKLVSQEWHNGAPVSAADVETAFARWGEWKGLVYWFWKWS